MDVDERENGGSVRQELAESDPETEAEAEAEVADERVFREDEEAALPCSNRSPCGYSDPPRVRLCFVSIESTTRRREADQETRRAFSAAPCLEGQLTASCS